MAAKNSNLLDRRYDTGPRNRGGKPTDRYSTANFPKVDNSPIPDDADQILKMLQSLPKQPAVDMGMGWSSAKQHASDIGSRQQQLINKANSLGMDVSYAGAKGFQIKPMTTEQLAARDTAKQTQSTKPGDIKLGPGGLPPEFRNQGNIAIPADFKPGVIMPTETERQEMENDPNFIKGLPAGLNPAGTPSAAWNAPQSPQQPNSRPIQSSLTGTPPPAWNGSSRGPESLRYLEWLRANPDGGMPGGSTGSRPVPDGGRPPIQNTGPENIPGRPKPTPPWMGGDNPYTPEIERPNNRPQMQRPSFGADYAVTSVTPEFNYTDPKKFKKEMLNLKQDIREAQADGDTEKLNRLIDKQNKANYTVQGLNAGLSQEEAARYAKREADIDAKAKAKGGAGGRIEEPGTVKRPSKAEMEDLQRRANKSDPRAQMELAKLTPADNFTGKSPFARTTPEESWALEKAAAAGDKRAKDEIALRKQTKDETGNHTLSMSRPALDSLHGLKDTPAQREAAEFVKMGQGDGVFRGNDAITKEQAAQYDKLKRAGEVPTVTQAEAQRLANGTPAEQATYDQLKRAGQLPGQDGKPITSTPDQVYRGGSQQPNSDAVKPPNRGGGFRTADFKDKNGNGTDDRDEGLRRGGGSQQPTAQSMFEDMDARNRAGEMAQQAAQAREAQRNQAARDAAAQKYGYPNAAAAEKAGMRIGNPGAKPPGGSGKGGGGGGGRGGGAKPPETAKQRNARMEAEADKQRDRLDRKIAAGYDPATNKWSTPKSPSRLPEKGKSSFPDKPTAKTPLSNIPKLSQGGNTTGITNPAMATAIQWAADNQIMNDIMGGNSSNNNSITPTPNNNPQGNGGWNNGGGMGGGQGGAGSANSGGQASGALIGYLKKKKEGNV